MNVLFELLLVYLIYRFVAGFLVPLYRTSRRMHQQFQDMNNRTAAGDGTDPRAAQPSQPPQDQPGHTKTGEAKVGEYIDFEEVK